MSYLTPLTKKIVPRNFAVLDLESKMDDTDLAGFTRPFLAGFYDGEECIQHFDTNPQVAWQERYYQQGGCVDLLMRTMLRRRYSGHYLYAHNAGRFDYLFLLPWMMGVGDRLGYKFTVVPVSSSIQMLKVTHGTHVWTFLDSLKLIPTSLDKAAKSFGLAGKQKHNLDLPESERDLWCSYNKVDLEQLYQVIQKFHHYVENVLCGEVGITAPSTAMKLFRRRYLKHQIPRSIECHDFVRSGYFGGRVEVFQTKGDALYYFDINSSYPAAMLEKMPVGEATYWEGKPPDRFLRERIGFLEVDVEVPEDTYLPVLPIRAPSGKLIFPVGRLTGVWSWEELREAITHGAEVKRWGRSVWFEGEPIFKDFVIDLYKYRDKSLEGYDEGLDAIVKILLNALYGKFGMRTLRKKIYRYDDPDLPSNATPAYPDPECPIWFAEEETDAPYIMPQLSAHITTLARLRLHRYMSLAKTRGGKLYYCDTDSIITDVELPTGTKLGELKNEYPDHGGRLRGEFLGPKLYILKASEKTYVKAKGLETNLKNEDTLRKLANGWTIFQERLEKVGTLARTGFSRGPKMRIVPRTLANEDAKRKIFTDGSTAPLSVRMW